MYLGFNSPLGHVNPHQSRSRSRERLGWGWLLLPQDDGVGAHSNSSARPSRPPSGRHHPTNRKKPLLSKGFTRQRSINFGLTQQIHWYRIEGSGQCRWCRDRPAYRPGPRPPRATPERYEAQLPVTGNSDRLWCDTQVKLAVGLRWQNCLT